MDPVVTYSLVGAGVVILLLIVWKWIDFYNKFQYWINKAQRAFADIDVMMQQRLDMLPALAQAIKKYDIHEYKALKDVIEARSRWSKDAPLNEKVHAVNDIDNSFLKIQAVFERYPELKASHLHEKIMGRGNISKMESHLRQARLYYNRQVQQYNMRVAQFPRNVVANAHGFKPLEYLTLGNQINQGPQETYNGKELFDD